ncbi:MAG: DUF4091 domain-containing protein [Planctomycetaceae bacterium]|nr:DUF4091 domain-containing protein [Planctomycetaceae bacterium]
MQHKSICHWISIFALLFLFTATAHCNPHLQTWTIDPLTKVFKDTQLTNSDVPFTEVARGEYATLQIVVRSDKKVESLTASLEPLMLNKTHKLENIKIRFVGYIPYKLSAAEPSSDRLVSPPAMCPDILLDDKTITLEPNQNQPIWLTIEIPTNTAPGIYTGSIKIAGLAAGQPLTSSITIHVKVYDVTLGKSRLWLTNWFYMSRYRQTESTDANLAKLEKFSPTYWDLMRKYARNMAQHRLNMALISPLEMTEYSFAPDGRFKFDFTNFDRAVRIFINEGVIGRIEGGHLGGRINNEWTNQFETYIYKLKFGKFIKTGAEPSSAEAVDFYSQFLPALAEHLKRNNWLNIYYQHIADEPIVGNAKSYDSFVKLVRKYAPQFKIIEACHTTKLTEPINIWVPQLNYLKQNFDFYKQRQRSGDEVWFYTCMYPQGEFANRFLELPLLKTRILHWINFRYGITGYLHWGYNFWNNNPYKNIGFEHTKMPDGDEWIVYPGIDGPLDSIRFEALRDGVDDYELLSMLAESNPDAAMRLAAKHVAAFDEYNVNIKTFRQTRRQLLEMLAKK